MAWPGWGSWPGPLGTPTLLRRWKGAATFPPSAHALSPEGPGAPGQGARVLGPRYSK